VLDLATGALADVVADVDDEELVRHRDLLEVDAAEASVMTVNSSDAEHGSPGGTAGD
jgi:hypothetical protein